MLLQIAAKLSVQCCHLANTNNEKLCGLATAIPHLMPNYFVILVSIVIYYYLLIYMYTKVKTS